MSCPVCGSKKVQIVAGRPIRCADCGWNVKKVKRVT